MIKKIITVALLAIATVAVVEMKNRKHQNESEGYTDKVCALPHECEATGQLPKLLDLGAGKCVPCRAMAPILDEMKETFSGQLEVEFIDVWQNKGVGKQYGIRMIPTQIFYGADGRELFRHEGFFSREEILKQWRQLGYVFAEAE